MVLEIDFEKLYTLKVINYISFLILFGFVFMMQSCVRDMDVEIDTFESKLVLNALVSTEEPWTLEVSKSGNILSDKDNIEKINDAIVHVLDINTNKTILLHNNNNGIYQHETITPIPGHEYKVKVSCKNYNSISAITTVPKSIQVIKNDSSVVVVDGIEMLSIDFDIVGERFEHNYYICELFKIENNSESNEITEDPIGVSFWDKVENQDNSRHFQSGLRVFIADNIDDNGGNSTTTVLLSPNNNGNGGDGGNDNNEELQYELNVKSVSKSYYDYFKALEDLNNQQTNTNNPKSLYSNVKNGYGVLGSYNTQIFPF